MVPAGNPAVVPGRALAAPDVVARGERGMRVWSRDGSEAALRLARATRAAWRRRIGDGRQTYRLRGNALRNQQRTKAK
jgi:hypothetical protein